MWFFVFKVIASGVIVALVSTLGKRYPSIAGLLTALPVISVSSLSFLYIETGGDALSAARLSSTIGWMVLPTVLFLFLFPALLKRGLPFISAMILSLIVMLILHGGVLFVLDRYSTR